jgi:FAD/FMN-containing dehydrogenase
LRIPPELSDLPNYIAEFSAMMKSQSRSDLLRSCRRWELHLRPVLNLKEKEGIHQFRSIATEVAVLVKKNTVVPSGEHGDGIVRGSFTFYDWR